MNSFLSIDPAKTLPVPLVDVLPLKVESGPFKCSCDFAVASNSLILDCRLEGNFLLRLRPRLSAALLVFACGDPRTLVNGEPATQAFFLPVSYGSVGYFRIAGDIQLSLFAFDESTAHGLRAWLSRLKAC